jgi:hypothetical protein
MMYVSILKSNTSIPKLEWKPTVDAYSATRRYLVENNTTRRSRYPNGIATTVSLQCLHNETMNDLCKMPTPRLPLFDAFVLAPFHYRFYSWPTGIYTMRRMAVAFIFLSSSFSAFSNFLRRQPTLYDHPTTFSLFLHASGLKYHDFRFI